MKTPAAGERLLRRTGKPWIANFSRRGSSASSGSRPLKLGFCKGSYRLIGPPLLSRALRALIGRLAFVVALALGGCACAPTTGGGAGEVRLNSTGARGGKGTKAAKVTQAELQEELQRFTGEFEDRVTQAMYAAIGGAPADETSNQAMRLALVSVSSALDIATEPLPEIGVLDMVVFLRLNRITLADYWVPKVLGERGQPLLSAFEASEQSFWRIADTILSADQKAKLIAGIDAWHRENPDQFRVEAVRFTDFAVLAGAAAKARSEEARGILSSVRAATVATDQAVLLAERGLFLANRMPFLIRLQARLGAREILGDTARSLGEFDSLAKSVHGLEPMVRQLPGLVAATTQMVGQSRLLVKEVEPLVPSAEGMARIQRALDTSNTLVAKSSTLLTEVRASTATGPDGPIERISRRVDSTLSRVLWYVIALGAAWSALWWGGYVLAKRAVGFRPPTPPAPPSTSPPSHDLQARDVARGAA
jgi:hypothetical protein